jgi:hypothetical protein
MKRTGLITLAACFAVLVMAVVVIRYPRTVPLDECSDVYKRYKDVEGVRATYVKDYRVNDTLTVGVTLLEATDSVAWVNLLQDFNVSDDMLQYARTNPSFDVWVRSVSKDNPTKPLDPSTLRDSVTYNLDLMAVSMVKREICIFHTLSRQETEAVLNYNYDVMIENKQ